jgi:hypothetical protein
LYFYFEQLTATSYFFPEQIGFYSLVPTVQILVITIPDINPEIDTLAVPGGPLAARIGLKY